MIQQVVSDHRCQPARTRSTGSCAAAPATITSWTDGKDLKKKPTPKENEVIFYTHTLCPYAHRVHLALLEKACVGNGSAAHMHVSVLDAFVV